MKLVAICFLVAVASAGLVLEDLGTGQSCPSAGGFNITSFSVSPFPPTCAAQAISMAGNFTAPYCPTHIYVHETYNQRQTYNQQYVLDNTCYVKGQANTFNFIINTVQCNSGNYRIQVDLVRNNPQTLISCWEYSYDI